MTSYSTHPNGYDALQDQHLGDPASGYKLLQGSGAFAPVVGDSLYYSNEGANPRWLNLTKLLGALTWAVGIGSAWSIQHNNWTKIQPFNAQSNCTLNTDVSWQMTQTNGGVSSLGTLESIDNFSWACSITYYCAFDVVASAGGALVANHNITTKVFKNGSETSLVGSNTTVPTLSGNITQITGWLLVNPGDEIDVRQYNNTTPTGATNLRVYIFSLDVVAQRLKT